MRSVRISADLERRLRESQDPLCQEIVTLLDTGRPAKKPPGMSFSELVAAFRANLGDSLLLPPKPSSGWIARQMARAKDLGLDHESISQISRGVQRAYPGVAGKAPRGYELEFLLRTAPHLIAASLRGADAGDSEGDLSTKGRGGDPSRVVTGRPELFED